LLVGSIAGPASAAAGVNALPVVAGLEIGIYVLGGPIMHARRGRWTTALIDVGVRVLAPVAGFALGYVIGGGSSSGILIISGGALLGALLGLVGTLTAIIVDVAQLAWVPASEAPPARPAHAALQWAPFVGATHGSPLAGVAGTF